jgi:hypothetical protein
MGVVRQHLGLACALVFFVAYASLLPGLYSRPRPPVSTEMEVLIPRFAQVLMSAGDRFLAANLAGFRALVVSTETMSAENYRILGLVQSDTAWLNPAHEDNYYIAAAILPWFGQLEAAQYILRRASDARTFDWQPAFYYGFNEYHFLKNPVVGAEWLRIAASHAKDELEQIQLQQMAAQWVTKAEDLELSIRLQRAMAKETRHKAFAAFLEKRAVRLENILLLDRAIGRYRELNGRPPSRIEELVQSSLLQAIPVDPFAMRYVIDGHGRVVAVAPVAVNSGSRK